MNIGPGLTLLGWALIGACVLYVFFVSAQRAQRRDARISLTVAIALLIAGLASITVGSGLVFINPEERGVVLSALSPAGYRLEALQPGLRWIMPYFESVHRYPISRQTYTMSITPAEGQVKGDDSILARTVDGQEVSVDASVIYALNPTEVVEVHIRWQDRYTDGLVRPLARGIIRDAVARYKIEEVVSSRRVEMVSSISEALARQMEAEGLMLVEFILRNITFSKEYAVSVEQKQIAQQQAEQAKYLVQKQQQEAERVRVEAQGQRDAEITRAEGDAQARVIRAKAEAEALSLINQALKENPDLLTYRYIEKLAPNVGVIMLPSGGTPFIINLEQLLAPTMPVSPTVPQ